MYAFIDVTDTWNSPLRTGVQKVVVESARALTAAQRATLVRFDRRRGDYVLLTAEQTQRLFSADRHTGAPPRAVQHWLARWGLLRAAAAVRDVGRRLSHPVRRVLGRQPHPFGRQAVLFTAEVVGDRPRTRALVALARRPGFRLVVAVHDLIPLTHPEVSLLHPSDLRRYLKVLAAADTLCPVSQTTGREVEAWKASAGLVAGPRVAVVWPGFPSPEGSPSAPSTPPLFLCVGTIEARKKQAALLACLEGLWAQGRGFEVVFAGIGSRTSAEFEAEYRRAVAQGRPVTWMSPASDEALENLYLRAQATVYLSAVEGFGLPVVESLTRGTPCVAAQTGAVGEVARTLGGCELVDPDDPETWALALVKFLDDPTHRDRLVAQVCRDRFRTWSDYADDLFSLLQPREAPSETLL